jgi:hypothetical protein
VKRHLRIKNWILLAGTWLISNGLGNPMNSNRQTEMQPPFHLPAFQFQGTVKATGLDLPSYNKTDSLANRVDFEKDQATPKTDSLFIADSLMVNSINSPARSSHHIETRFWHDLALYDWYTRLHLQQALSSHWQLEFTETFISTLQMLQPQTDRWKDNHNARVTLRRDPSEGPNILSGWQWQLSMDSKIFRDDFSQPAGNIRNNDFSLTGMSSRLERRFDNKLRVSNQIGYRLEQLLGRTDHGPLLGVSVTLAPTIWQNYHHQFDAEAEMTQLPQRRNEDVNLAYGISRQFAPGTSDSLFVQFAHLRREKYFADVTTLYIDLLNRNRRGLENRLSYQIPGGWRFALRTELSESKVRIARRRLEDKMGLPEQKVDEFDHTDFEVRHHAELQLQKDRLSNDFALRFFSQSVDYSDQVGTSPLLRRYPGVGYDSEDWHLLLSHRLRWRFGQRDSLRWYGGVARLAHDTGNRDNPDDFDRLTFQANLLYGHRFSPRFLMRWEAHAFLEHHVYLKSSHSAGNNWRRVLKLQPSLVFDLAPGFYLKQSFGVLAQYIDYDFPEPLSLGQSNVFRNFFIADSLSFRLSRRTQGLVQYTLRLEERGSLDWKRWRQRPWLDRNEHWAYILFEHQPAKFWELAPGVTFLRQSNWSYQLDPLEGLNRYFSGGQTILTPMLSISYERFPQAVLIFSARRQIVYRHHSRSTTLDSFGLTVQWSN